MLKAMESQVEDGSDALKAQFEAEKVRQQP